MKEFNVFDNNGNLIAIVADKDRAEEIAEREDGYYRSVEKSENGYYCSDEKSDRKGDKKMKEETRYILKDMGTDRTYYVTLTAEQKRFWNWLINNGVLCDVSLKEPVVEGFEKI